LAALHAIHGSRERTALLCMAAALAIDGLDGFLARRVGVGQLLRRWDGALLDNITDYLNYVVVPAFFIQHAGLLPAGTEQPAAALICVGSALQFSQTDAKTQGHCFRGFPSCWNVVAFYLLVLRLHPWVALAWVVALCGLLFVPLLYPHPLRTRPLRGLTLSLTCLWALAMGTLLWQYPGGPRWLAWSSLSFPVYYALLGMQLSRAAARGLVRT
jgi:phosphatidylcholine synthase